MLMCNMSGVTCQLSRVRCHVSDITCQVKGVSASLIGQFGLILWGNTFDSASFFLVGAKKNENFFRYPTKIIGGVDVAYVLLNILDFFFFFF